MKRREIQRIVQEYFTLTRSERRGLSVLAVILILSIGFHFMADRIGFQKETDFTAIKELLKEMDSVDQDPISERKSVLFDFDPNTIDPGQLDSLDLPGHIIRNLVRYRTGGGYFRSREDIKKLYGMTDSVYEKIAPYIQIRPKISSAEKKSDSGQPELFFFDPNTVGAEELRRLGMNGFQANNLISFRDKGGSFRIPADLKKIYGLGEVLYEQLEPFIRIPAEVAEESPPVAISMYEINSADSLGLLNIPGIGPVFASRIIKYREELGGFYSLAQLSEVYGMTGERMAQINPHLILNNGQIRQIRLNFADVSDLRRHPYITAGQARLIVNTRSEKGPYRQANELIGHHIFNEEELERIGPYLSIP